MVYNINSPWWEDLLLLTSFVWLKSQYCIRIIYASLHDHCFTFKTSSLQIWHFRYSIMQLLHRNSVYHVNEKPISGRLNVLPITALKTLNITINKCYAWKPSVLIFPIIWWLMQSYIDSYLLASQSQYPSSPQGDSQLQMSAHDIQQRFALPKVNLVNAKSWHSPSKLTPQGGAANGSKICGPLIILNFIKVGRTQDKWGKWPSEDKRRNLARWNGQPPACHRTAISPWLH
jgi:hypothetical protein